MFQQLLSTPSGSSSSSSSQIPNTPIKNHSLESLYHDESPTESTEDEEPEQEPVEFASHGLVINLLQSFDEVEDFEQPQPFTESSFRRQDGA